MVRVLGGLRCCGECGGFSWYVWLGLWRLMGWVGKLRRVTGTERRVEQTKGTAATPASAALLPLVVSLVFNLRVVPGSEKYYDPAKVVGRFAFAEVICFYVVSDWL
jgi:hypothetical protein